MNDKELQFELERFGRMYVACSQVSRLVVHRGSREELEREVVRVLVEVGGFAMALVSWHDPATEELVPVACFGDTHGYVQRIKMFADARPEGTGPGGMAFRSGTAYICNDFPNDPLTRRWREAAAASGWCASAAFPISIEGSPRGLLSVYSRESGFFGPDQVKLLEAVVADLAFGLEQIDRERQRRQIEHTSELQSL